MREGEGREGMEGMGRGNREREGGKGKMEWGDERRWGEREGGDGMGR